MISAIGFQRFMILVILAGLAIALGLFEYMVAMPNKNKALAELQGLRGNISTLKTELENMQTNMHIFEARKAVFQEMQQKEFFGNQDRADARDRVNTIQKLSKVLSAKYEIRPAEIEDQPDAPETFEYTILKSSIKVTLSAVDDTDIYRFIYFLNYGFPGHVLIKDINIERRLKIDENLLKDIGRGFPPEIVVGTIELEWRTMVRKDEVDIAPKVEGRGEAAQ